MDKADFDEWLEHPVTEIFLKHLKSLSKEESVFVADAILNGEIIPADDQIRISTMSLTLLKISEISFEDIEDSKQ